MTIDAAYVDANAQIVREQLQKAAVRLAHLLDAALGKWMPERRAAERGVGVHAHRCQPSWKWRAQQGVEKKAAQ